MPELPDITIYLAALEQRIAGHTLERVHLTSPFLVRTAVPPISAVEGKQVCELRRLGKRICVGLEDELWLVLHLMIAGRLHWKDGVAQPRRAGTGPTKFSKNHLATFQFDNGILSLTEAGTQRRASLHIVQGEAALRTLDRGGVELFRRADGISTQLNGGLGDFIDLESFTRVVRSENHTLKRALTDPRLFSGVGNAYSDEILWHAQLSPVKLTQKLTDEEVLRLYESTREALVDWVERLRDE